MKIMPSTINHILTITVFAEEIYMTPKLSSMYKVFCICKSCPSLVKTIKSTE